MIAYALTLSATLLPAQPGEAELLLRRMDAKTAAAKTLRIEVALKEAKDDGPSNLVLVLGDRNRFRFEGGVTLVGDGKRVGLLDPRAGTLTFYQQPEWHNEVLRASLGRGGTVNAMMKVSEYLAGPGAKWPDGSWVSDARLLPDEEVNGVKCRLVAYRLHWGGGIPTRVWIDPKTDLPVRREMRFEGHLPRGGWDLTLTTTHTKFEIDPKLEAKLFELPK